MYRNVKAEFARGDIKYDIVCERLGISNTVLSLKMTGKSPFTVNEAKAIQALIHEINGVLIPLDELFKEAGE